MQNWNGTTTSCTENITSVITVRPERFRTQIRKVNYFSEHTEVEIYHFEHNFKSSKIVQTQFSDFRMMIIGWTTHGLHHFVRHNFQKNSERSPKIYNFRTPKMFKI